MGRQMIQTFQAQKGAQIGREKDLAMMPCGEWSLPVIGKVRPRAVIKL